MVREGWKHSEGVQRGSSICHKCQNMHPEPGVAHQWSKNEGRVTSSTLQQTVIGSSGIGQTTVFGCAQLSQVRKQFEIEQKW